MTKYNVHLYREMRLYYPGIEAESPTDAAAIVAQKETGDAEKIECCEGENLGALVDLVGDHEFEHSVNIDFEPERLRKAAPTLLGALQSLVDATSCYARHFHEHMVARTVISEATNGTPQERQLIVIEVRGGVVQDVLNVPAGTRYEIRDYDNQEETAEAGRDL
jgi:hypothetical protein